MNVFIDWETLENKKSNGKEKIRCPSCDAKRSDKRDKSLVLNHNDGYGKCFYCEALTFRDNKKEFTEKEYTLPVQTWRNYTEISDNLVKWIKTERGINQSTLIYLGVTEEKFYQPALQKEVNNIVFNYFEGETLINKKYRSGGKHFTQSSGTKPMFYNINSIIGKKECFIVEGEFDVLALHEYGIKNVISVPNGANDNDNYWANSEKYLKDIENFIIAVDNDEKGNILKDKIAQRLGRYRCKFVEWKNKDANGDLLNDCIKETIQTIRSFPVSGTHTTKSLYKDILELYDNGLPETIFPLNECFGNMKDVYTGMRGHLATITGIPSHGKSNFSEWYVLNLVKDYNMKASFFSPEHSPMQLHQTNFIQKAVGKPFWKAQDGIERVTKTDIDRYVNWANEKIYLTGTEKGETPSWDWLLDKFKEQMFTYGIDIFVIDAFNKLELPPGNNLQQINRVLTKLTMFAQQYNVMVFLVVHPTKMQKDEQDKYKMPSLYDCSGSADFRNQTHDGFCIYRHFGTENNDDYTTFVNLKTKMNFQGKIGQQVDFNYHTPTGRYYMRGTHQPVFDMTIDSKKVEMLDFASELTEDDYEVPF